jgi:hypothetical protein
MPFRVSDRRPDIGGDHFMAEPVLTLFRPDGTTAAVIEHTASLELSPDRRRLAWLRQTRTRTCTIDETGCEEPSVHVVVGPLADLDDHRTWGPFERVRYALWVDDDSLLLVQPAGGARVLDTRTGQTRALGFKGNVVGVSPQSRRITSLSDDVRTVYVTSLDTGALLERNYPNQRIGVAAAPQGDTLLMVLADPPVGGTARRHLRLLHVATGAEVPLAESSSDGELLWSADGSSFGYRRLVGNDTSFDFRVCARATPDVCRTVLSWESETDILAL